jgi:flavin reductase (DIM6/NTAB) family NADH-FMN oxidoreductase RutF
MFNWLKNKKNEKFVDSAMRDNWYQANSYWPAPFALVTTQNENGETNIGPHSFSMPFGIISDYSLVLITRYNSNTAINLQRTGKCAFNFIEFNKKQLKDVVGLGYPGQTTEEKMKLSPFELIETPTIGRQSSDGLHPKIINDAFQVYECTLDTSVDYHYNGKTTARHFIVKLDNILLKEQWKKNIDDGNPRMPNMPISYGFRDGKDFWFTQHKTPFIVPVPTDRGPKSEAVMYLANRIDPDVRFTKDACERLTGVPKVFLKTALNGIIKRAKEEGISEIDGAFVKRINDERNQK